MCEMAVSELYLEGDAKSPLYRHIDGLTVSVKCSWRCYERAIGLEGRSCAVIHTELGICAFAVVGPDLLVVSQFRTYIIVYLVCSPNLLFLAPWQTRVYDLKSTLSVKAKRECLTCNQNIFL